MTQERVLRNVKRVSRNSIVKIRSLVQQEATTDLSEFLFSTGLILEDLYRNKTDGGWTRLLRSQDLISKPASPSEFEDFLLGRVRSLLHVNDPVRVDRYLAILDADGQCYHEMSTADQTFTQMLVTLIWANQSGTQPPSTYDEALKDLRSCPSFISELHQVFSYRLDQSLSLIHI